MLATYLWRRGPHRVREGAIPDQPALGAQRPVRVLIGDPRHRSAAGVPGDARVCVRAHDVLHI